MKLLAKLAPLAMLAVPMLVAAQSRPNLGYFNAFGGSLIELIRGTLIPLVFALAFLMFLWGMFNTFILGGSDEGKQEKGRQLMIYAIIGFVLMTAVWGIVNLVSDIFGVDGQQNINIPNLPRP